VRGNICPLRVHLLVAALFFVAGSMGSEEVDIINSSTAMVAPQENCFIKVFHQKLFLTAQV
jgi:hypothetical protein